jgi:psiF repeat
MRFLAAILAALFASGMALADTDCLAKAAEKKLSGAAKTSFVNKCVRDGCEAAAAEKKLAGAANTSFTKKCVADGLQPLCESQATDKKLAGAARDSFMKKCQSGN